MIFKDLNKKFNKIFIILLIICIFNIFLYNYKIINVNNKEIYMNASDLTSNELKNNILSQFKENIFIKNKNLLTYKCNLDSYYTTGKPSYGDMNFCKSIYDPK